MKTEYESFLQTTNNGPAAANLVLAEHLTSDLADTLGYGILLGKKLCDALDKATEAGSYEGGIPKGVTYRVPVFEPSDDYQNKIKETYRHWEGFTSSREAGAILTLTELLVGELANHIADGIYSAKFLEQYDKAKASGAVPETAGTDNRPSSALPQQRG